MCLGSLSIWSLCVIGNLSLIKGANDASIILPNRIAVKFSEKSTRGAAPFVDIVPQMWILRGCFDFGLNFWGLPTLLYVFRLRSIITVHSSDHITSLNFSPFTVCCRHHNSRFHLLFSLIIWQ